jgi:hypothetical protein
MFWTAVVLVVGVVAILVNLVLWSAGLVGR